MLTVAAVAVIVANFAFILGFDRAMFTAGGLALLMLTIRFLP